jgi:hypothetical protein
MNNMHDVRVAETAYCESLFAGGRKNILFSVLFSLYLGLSLIRFVWPAQLINSFILMAMGIIALVAMTVKIDRRHVNTYIFIMGLIFSVIVSSLFVGRAERVEHSIIFALCGAGIALLILKKKVSSWSGYLVFYGMTSYFITLMIFGADARYALSGSSHNGISMMMLVTCISLYAISGLQNKKIDVLPAILTFIVCVWAIGRSGILASLILLVGILLLKWKLRGWTIFYPIIIVCFFGFIVIVNQDYLLFIMDYIIRGAIENYSIRTTQEEPRFMMWGNYYDNLDFRRIVFGVNLLEDPWPEGEEYAYNYHNTWINLHAQTGLMGLLVCSFLFCALIKYFNTNRLFFILLLVLLVRWTSDIGLFFESWDFLIYFFIFHFLSLRFYSRIN